MGSMGLCGGRSRRASVVVTLLVTLGALVVLSAPSVADVTEVTGSAFGYHGYDLVLRGGDPEEFGPTPYVELAPDASNSPQTATAESGEVTAGGGIAFLFTSGEITVSTAGSLGPDGSVTSSAEINDLNQSGEEIFDADQVRSTCTATEEGVTASTTIVNGTVRTHAQSAHEQIVEIPTNPPVNYTVESHIHLGTTQDNYRIVFNEQTMNADGSITVNAVHEYFLGPNLSGHLILGQSVCGVEFTQTTTTTFIINSLPTT